MQVSSAQISERTLCMSHFESIFRAIASTAPRNASALAHWPVNFGVSALLLDCVPLIFLTCVQKHNRYTKLIFSDKISVVNFTKNLATDVRYIFMYVEYF